MGKRWMVGLLAICLFLVAGCAERGTPTEESSEEEEQSAAHEGDWVQGRELTAYLVSLLYATEAQPYPLEILEPLDSEGESGGKPEEFPWKETEDGIAEPFEIPVKNTPLFDPLRYYPLAQLKAIPSDKIKQTYNDIIEGKQTIRDYLEPSETRFLYETVTPQKKANSHLVELEGEDDDKKLVMLGGYDYRSSTKEDIGYRELFDDGKFQKELLGSGLDLNNLSFYVVDNLFSFQNKALILTDGKTDLVYVGFTQTKKATVKRGLYPIGELLKAKDLGSGKEAESEKEVEPTQTPEWNNTYTPDYTWTPDYTDYTENTTTTEPSTEPEPSVPELPPEDSGEGVETSEEESSEEEELLNPEDLDGEGESLSNDGQGNVETEGFIDDISEE